MSNVNNIFQIFNYWVKYSKFPTNLKLEWVNKVGSLDIKTKNWNIWDFSYWFTDIAYSANCIISHLDSEQE